MAAKPSDPPESSLNNHSKGVPSPPSLMNSFAATGASRNTSRAARAHGQFQKPSAAAAVRSFAAARSGEREECHWRSRAPGTARRITSPGNGERPYKATQITDFMGGDPARDDPVTYTATQNRADTASVAVSYLIVVQFDAEMRFRARLQAGRGDGSRWDRLEAGSEGGEGGEP